MAEPASPAGCSWTVVYRVAANVDGRQPLSSPPAGPPYEQEHAEKGCVRRTAHIRVALRLVVNLAIYQRGAVGIPWGYDSWHIGAPSCCLSGRAPTSATAHSGLFYRLLNPAPTEQPAPRPSGYSTTASRGGRVEWQAAGFHIHDRRHQILLADILRQIASGSAARTASTIQIAGPFVCIAPAMAMSATTSVDRHHYRISTIL